MQVASCWQFVAGGELLEACRDEWCTYLVCTVVTIKRKLKLRKYDFANSDPTPHRDTTHGVETVSRPPRSVIGF